VNAVGESLQFNRIVAASLVILCLIATILSGSKASVKTSPSAPALGSDSGADRIAVFAIQGPIAAGTPSVFADAAAPTLQSRLRQALKEDRVKGVLLQVNSPGGTVGTSQEIYRGIMALREAGKPVVVTMEDIAASGGYYVASAADKIYANPGTLTGSIGVIIEGINAQKLLENLGIQPETIKTGSYKDILSPFREPTPEEVKLLQGVVDNTLAQFIKDVSRGRQKLPITIKGSEPILSKDRVALREQMTEDKVKQLADGRIFTGQQAVDLGLIDALGGFEEGIADLRRLLGDKNNKLAVGSSTPTFEEFLQQLGLNSRLWIPFWNKSESPLDKLSPLLWIAPQALWSEDFRLH
jgi:protease-4